MPKLPRYCPECGAPVSPAKPGTKPSTKCKNCRSSLLADERVPYAEVSNPRRSGTPVLLLVLLGGAGFLFLGAVVVGAIWLTRGDPPQPIAPPQAKAEGKPAAPEPKQARSPLVDTLTPEAEKAVRRATVYIRVTLANASTASGSGFFERTTQLVVTNAHVVGMLEPDSSPPTSIEMVVNSGEGPALEKKVKARVTAVDRDADLAVLAPDEQELPKAQRPTGLPTMFSNTLKPTQKVYTFGFPFGEGLGKEITTTETTVSSMRNNEDGSLHSIQVAGGINPGNSGGPVVDARGRLAGIAVSGIRGAQIQFAIPVEKMNELFIGSIGTPKFGTIVGTGAERKVSVSFSAPDPKEELFAPSVNWWFAKPGPPLAASIGRHEIPGAFKVETLEYDRVAGIAKGEIPIGDPPPGAVLWVVPVRSTLKQNHRFGASVTLDVLPKTKAVASRLSFGPSTPPGLLSLVVRTDLRLTANGQEGRRLRTAMYTELRESIGKALDGRYPMEWQIAYADMESALDEAPYAPGPRLQTALSSIRSSFIKSTISPRGEPGPITFQAFQDPSEDLSSYSNRLANTLVALSVPLPEDEVKPGDTWKATRTIPIELPGEAQEGTLELTYTYEGMRNFGNHRCANIVISGTLRGIRNRSTELKGTANGLAIVSLHSGRVLRSRLTADVSLELQIAQGRFSARGTTEASLARTNDAGVQTGPLPEETTRNPLVGKWETIKLESDGKERPRQVGASFLIIEDGRYFHQSRTGTTGPIRYRLRADGKSGLLDAITFLPDGTRGSIPGIYKIEGDRMFLCQNHKNDARPTGYETTTGSGLVCYHLKRAAVDDRVIVIAKPIEKPKLTDDFENDPKLVVPVDGPPATLPVPVDESAALPPAEFPKISQRAREMHMTPDGTRLVTAINKTLVVWDRAGKQIAELMEGDNGGLDGVSLSADGTRCATVRNDGTACVWDLASGKEICKWMVPAQVRCVAISPGGKQVAVGCADHAIRFYHAADGTPYRRIDKLGHPIQAVRFSPNGQLLAAAASGEVRYFRSDTGKLAYDRLDRVFAAPSMAFTPDSQSIVLNGGSVRLIRISDGAVIKELPVEAHEVAMSADGTLVAAHLRTTNNHTVVVWSTRTWGEATRMTAASNLAGFAFALSPRGRWLFYDTADKQIQRKELPANAKDAVAPEPPKATPVRVALKFDVPAAHPLLVRFSPDGTKLLLHREKDFSLWDAVTGKRLHRFEWDRMAVSQGAFAKDSEIIYSAGGTYAERTNEPIDFRVHVLDAKSGKVLRHVDGLSSPARGLDVSPDGKRLILGLNDRKVEFWDLDQLKPMSSIRTQQIPVSLSFSSDGKVALAVLVGVGRIVLFDPEAGRESKSFDKGNVQEAVFLPDSKRVLSVGSDGLMRLWNVDRGTEMKQWGGPGLALNHLSLSADGKRALACGEKEMLRLWDVESGKELASWWDPDGWGIPSISPDGKRFVTSTPKGVRIIEIDK